MRDAVDLEQAQLADLGFDTVTFDGIEQPAHVEVAVDLDVLGDGQGDVRPDALGVPQGRLSGGKGEGLRRELTRRALVYTIGGQ
ncbi:hypothetical protein ACTD5D_15525 [Nocardia takedensis]|uniref:hypothetical protein n=1 Tax=Nocardia takedensis TaxID=259390 RepID=UPI003F76C2BA